MENKKSLVIPLFETTNQYLSTVSTPAPFPLRKGADLCPFHHIQRVHTDTGSLVPAGQTITQLLQVILW
jgi:hypothetical protein